MDQKTILRSLCGLILLTLGAVIAQAAPETLSVGMTLPPNQIQQIPGRELIVHGKPLKVLGQPQPEKRLKETDGAVSSYVINSQGQVGRSLNEIIITRATTDEVQQAISALKTTPVSVHHYEHLNSSSLRFATFEQAVSAQNEMKTLLPQAAVALPIQYQRRKPR